MLLLAVLLGCDLGERPADPTGLPPLPPVIDAGEVALRTFDYEGIRMLIDSYRGRVVVVNYWAADCPRCVDQLPNLVEIDQAFSAEDVCCISVSLDYKGLKDLGPESYKESVLKRLAPLETQMDHLLAADAEEVMFEKLDLTALPAVDVYGRDGKRVRRFAMTAEPNKNEAFTYQEVKRLVHGLVESSAGSY